MRTNLKVFRVKQNMTQDEIAEKIGCSRSCYASIENGDREGRGTFWRNFQKAFDVPDSEMWTLKKNE